MTAEEALHTYLDNHHNYEEAPTAHDILAALAAAGFAVVPVKCTDAMIEVGERALAAWDGDGDEGLHQTAPAFMWSAMLAAAAAPRG